MKPEYRNAKQPTPDPLALAAARLKIAAATAAKAKPRRMEALPQPEGQRVDNSPYRKESRQ